MAGLDSYSATGYETFYDLNQIDSILCSFDALETVETLIDNLEVAGSTKTKLKGSVQVN